MPTGYRKAGVDFEALFDPDIVGDGPESPLTKVGGVPLKFANISYGAKGPDVGIREGGVDISNKWAAAGTAVYVNLNTFPDLIEDVQVGSSAPVTSSASFTFLRNGTFTWSPGGGGNWGPLAIDTGDAYDLRITKLTGSNSAGDMSGVLADPSSGPVQVQLNTSRSILLENVKVTGGAIRARRILFIELVRRSDSVVVDSITTNLEAESDIS